MDVDVEEFLYFLIEDGWIPRELSEQRERMVIRYQQSRVEDWYRRNPSTT